MAEIQTNISSNNETDDVEESFEIIRREEIKEGVAIHVIYQEMKTDALTTISGSLKETKISMKPEDAWVMQEIQTDSEEFGMLGLMELRMEF